MSRAQKYISQLLGPKGLSEDPVTGNTILNFRRQEYEAYTQNVFVNKLDDYMLTQNHITLSIVDVTGMQTPVKLGEQALDPAAGGAIGQFSAQQLLEAPYIPFAFSGAVHENDFLLDTHLQIQDFNFKSIRCPTNVDPFRIGFQSGNMTINESYGFSFDDLITDIAEKANYNYWESNTSNKGISATRFIYRIDIHFSGWKEDGTFENKIEFEYPYTPDKVIRRNTFTMFAHVHKTQGDVNATGSTTVLDMVPYSEVFSFPENAVFQEMGSLVALWKERLGYVNDTEEADAGTPPSVKRTDPLLDDVRSRYPEIREARFRNPFSSVSTPSEQSEIRDQSVAGGDELDITLEQWITTFTEFLNENTASFVTLKTDGDLGNLAEADIAKLPEVKPTKRNTFEIHAPSDLLSEIVIKGSHPYEYTESLAIDRVFAAPDIITHALFNCPKVREGMKKYPRTIYLIRTQVDYSQATYFEAINDWVNIKVNYYIDEFEDYRYIPDNKADTFSKSFERMLALISTKSIKRVYHDDHFAANTEIISYNTKYNNFYYKNLKINTDSTQLEYIYNEFRRRDFVLFDNDNQTPVRGGALGLTGEESQEFMKVLFDGFQGYDNSPFIRSSSSLAKKNQDISDSVTMAPHLWKILQRIENPIEGTNRASIEADKNLALFSKKAAPNTVDVEVSIRQIETANYLKEYNNMMEYDLVSLDGFEVRGDPQWLFGLTPTMLFPDYDQKPLEHTKYTADVIMIKSISPEASEYMARNNLNYPIQQRYNASGLYQIYEVEHKFQGGNYTQTMNGVRLIGLDTKINEPETSDE